LGRIVPQSLNVYSTIGEYGGTICMKKILRRLKKIQWRLTFTYMAATLVMLFLVELLVLVSNNRNAFSNPFFINSIARSLAESSRNLGAALDSPYDFEAIHDWVQSNKPLARSTST
jgi:hypothetical protein